MKPKDLIWGIGSVIALIAVLAFTILICAATGLAVLALASVILT